MDDLAIVILAAGKGTRMKSDLPKVLHMVAGQSMIGRVAACAMELAPARLHIVVGHKAHMVKAEVTKFYSASFAFQNQLLGTGDAVKSALPGLGAGVDHVLVLCGDVPLIRPATLFRVIDAHRQEDAKLTVLGVEVDNPQGYGRIIQNSSGELVSIREEADATDAEKKITRVNSGIYCFARKFLEEAIESIRPDNNQGEYYLTDLVEIAVRQGEKTCVAAIDDVSQVMGVNTLNELKKAEGLIHSGAYELP